MSVCVRPHVVSAKVFNASSLNLAQKAGGPVDNQTTVKPSASYSQYDTQNTVDTSHRLKQN